MNIDQTFPEDRRDPDAPVTRADLASVQRQLSTGDMRMTAIEAELRNNTALTADIRALLEAARVGLRVVGTIGTAVTFLAKLVGGITAIYAAWHLLFHGNPPK